MTILAANVGQGGDDGILTNTFMKLNRQTGIIAVDWRTHLLLVSVSAGGQVEVWRPD